MLRNTKLYRIIIILSIASLILPGFVFGQTTMQAIEAPETIEMAKAFAIKILWMLPDAIKGVWDNEAMPLWRNMWGKAQDFWYNSARSKIEPRFQWVSGQTEALWSKFLELLGKEVEKRKPELKEEFQKEKEEMRAELPKVGRSLWERLKELLN